MTTTASSPPPTTLDVAPGTDGLQRAGGIAGFVTAATYVVGLGLIGVYLAPQGYLDVQGSPEDSLAFLLDHQVMLYSWYLVLYLVGGIALVSLVLGVHSRLRTGAAALPRPRASSVTCGQVCCSPVGSSPWSASGPSSSSPRPTR